MRAGTLDSRVTFEVKQVTKDPDYGSEVVEWVAVAASVPANVQDVLPSKTEAVTQGVAIASQRTRVRIRYRSDITPDMRVVLHGPPDRVTQIVGGPAVIGRREGMELLVEGYSV